MQFFTFVTALVLAVVAVSATPTGAVANTVRTLPSFDETLAKITLAHPGLSADEHQGMTDGFLDAVAQVSSRDNSLVSFFSAQIICAIKLTRK